MAIVQSGKSATRPGGAGKTLTMDVANGQTRARKKRRPRGKAKTITESFRRNWMKCSRYMVRWYDNRIQKTVRDACHGTQVLWDDFITMTIAGTAYGIIELDGVKLYPVVFVNAVNESIDTIGQKNGDMLYRLENRWARVPIGPAGSVLTYHENNTLPSWEM